MEDKKNLEDLIALVKKLRGPDGCPWDKEQKASDINPILLVKPTKFSMPSI